MRISPDRLGALLSPPVDVEERPRRVPYPTLGQLLYEPASDDDAPGRRCGNCYKFIASGACVEVSGEIDAAQVCGLHVRGEPQATMPTLGAPASKRSPVDVALTQPAGVVACETCRFFTPDEPAAELGSCAAAGAHDGMPPVSVESGGCCSRWEPSR